MKKINHSFYQGEKAKIMAKSKKKGRKTPISDKINMIIGTLIMCLLFIGSLFLTVKYIREFSASKTYKEATAYIISDVNIDRITKKDNYGNITSETNYYDYEYAFEVNGKKYTGSKTHVEEYYGDTFTVLYDENNPEHFVIADEAAFPVLLCIATIILGVLSGLGIYRTITD